MTTLAERLAPHMAGSIWHPGDAETKPFPLVPPPMFRTATLPPGQLEEMAKDAGLPSPDFAKTYCEAWLHLVQTEGNVTLVDNAELADLRAAAAVNEGKRNQVKECVTMCGAPAYRMTIRDFDTDHPRVPCAAVAGHECGVK